MAMRLGEHLVYGELRNIDNYSTHGYLVLRGETPGEDLPLHIELTGNCDADLRGKHFRFEPGGEGMPPTPIPREDYERLAIRQVGATGAMTTQGWVRALPCSVTEFLQRARLGEPPPTKWTRHVYLEWFSQNGRVLFELTGALVEECIREPIDEGDAGEWIPIPNLALPPACILGDATAGPGITVTRGEGDDCQFEEWTSDSRPEGEEGFDAALPEDLQRMFDAEADAIDRALRDDGAEACPDDPARENCEPREREGEPFFHVLADMDNLPPSEALSDENVEILLKNLLAQMALIGVALSVCPHYTPRACYELLRNTIFPEDSVNTRLIGKGFAQHYMTHEFCDICEAEMEAEMEASDLHDESED